MSERDDVFLDGPLPRRWPWLLLVWLGVLLALGVNWLVSRPR